MIINRKKKNIKKKKDNISTNNNNNIFHNNTINIYKNKNNYNIRRMTTMRNRIAMTIQNIITIQSTAI